MPGRDAAAAEADADDVPAALSSRNHRADAAAAKATTLTAAAATYNARRGDDAFTPVCRGAAGGELNGTDPDVGSDAAASFSAAENSHIDWNRTCGSRASA